MDNKVIPIVFSANAKYAPYIAVTITSIIKNSSSLRNYKFYVLYTELPSTTILRLEDISGVNYETKCVNAQDFCREGMYPSAYFSVEMYYRIMIPEIFPQYDKVLYLDCDIVVLRDISELYDADVSDYLIGGIRNMMHEKMKKYILFSLEVDTGKYINSGVILFNCERCRKENFTENAFKLLIKRQDFRYPDQDLINIMCIGKILYLDPRWNFTWHYRHLQESSNMELHLSEEDMQKFLEYEQNPYLIHYTGETKPWDNVNKYLSDYFWKYAKDSNFFNLFLNRLINANKSITSNVEYEKRIQTLEKKVADLGRILDKNQEMEKINKEKNEFINKYNEVIGSKSYKIGRLLTFPFRKTCDLFRSIKKVGIRETLKLFPKKIKLYWNIIRGIRE